LEYREGRFAAALKNRRTSSSVLKSDAAGQEGRVDLATRNFRELLEAMPADRQRKIERRFQKSLAAMPLDQLRKAQEMTQLQLAGVLGFNQGEVSKIERRSDICVSTLAEYVEAMGGRLEIRAVSKDREIRISQFEELAG
jgi:hypothetical protein